MESALQLDWSAPAGCPDAEAVRSQVIRLAGVTAPASRHLKAKASIQNTAGTGLVLTLVTEVGGVTGERTLKGVSCDSLTDAAALLLALIVNPTIAVSAPEPVATLPAEPPAKASATARRLAPAWQVGAYAGVQTGVLDDLSPSFMLSLGAALGRFSLHLLPGLTPPQDVFIPNTQPKVGGRLWLATLDALGCWTVTMGPVALRPCLGFDVTRLHGRGLGVVQVSESTVYWSAAELAAFAGLHVSRRMLVEIGAIGQVPLHRPRVYLDEIGAVSRPAAFGFKALGGLAWVFE